MNLHARPELDSQQLRSLAAEILSREEYAEARLERSQEWLLALVEWLRSFSFWIDGLYATSPLQFWLLFGSLLVVLLLLIAHMSWSVSVALRRSPEQSVPELPAVARDFASEARQLAKQGRYLEAAHQLLLASLQQVVQARVIELQPNDTNLVVRAALESSAIPSPLRNELVELIRTTDRAWFRNSADDPELYARWADAYGQLVQVTQ